MLGSLESTSCKGKICGDNVVYNLYIRQYHQNSWRALYWNVTFCSARRNLVTSVHCRRYCCKSIFTLCCRVTFIHFPWRVHRINCGMFGVVVKLRHQVVTSSKYWFGIILPASYRSQERQRVVGGKKFTEEPQVVEQGRPRAITYVSVPKIRRNAPYTAVHRFFEYLFCATWI